jgi:hypothetical protein
MKISTHSLLVAALLAAGAMGQAQATAYTPVTVQGAVYTLSSDASGTSWTLGVDIDGYTGGGSFLENVAIKVSSHVNSATLDAAPAGWALTAIDSGINAGGCDGAGSGFLCASGHSALPVTPNGAGVADFSFTFGVDGSNWVAAPTIKARYVDLDGNKIGALVSQTVTAVPEPETYALMMAGLGAVGFIARRRRVS